MLALDKKERLAKMHRGFNPRNIAVVGAARHNNYGYIRRHLAFQQNNHGKVFHVNIDKNEWPGAEALGVQNFSSMMDIPEPVDYVAVSVPRQVVPTVLADCIKKGVSVVHIFTAGFEETGEEEGIRLDRMVKEMAQKSGILILGPNCLGLTHPALGVGLGGDLAPTAGGFLGYISNSGTQTMGFVNEAYACGIKVSKAFSMGNGMILDHADLLDYLAEDEDTKVIGMFMEGLRDPQRFFASLREACQKKPVLLWKVGRSEDAARAVTAHTASTFLRQDMWNALVAKCGGIPVNGLDEVMDSARALDLVPPADGYNMGMIAVSGGHSTEMANVFSMAGFKVVPLTDRSYQELSTVMTRIWGNYENPIEGAEAHRNFGRVVDILRRDENVDIVVTEISAGRLATGGEQFFADTVKDIKKFQEQSNKPIIVLATTSFPRVDTATLDSITQRLTRERIPVFSSFERGAKAIKIAVDYHAQKSYLAD